MLTCVYFAGRKLDKPTAKHLDPFQANILELTASATNPMDFLSLGEQGVAAAHHKLY
jgi:hypothetical protein